MLVEKLAHSQWSVQVALIAVAHGFVHVTMEQQVRNRLIDREVHRQMYFRGLDQVLVVRDHVMIVYHQQRIAID